MTQEQELIERVLSVFEEEGGLEDEIKAVRNLQAEVQRCHERLEITHVYRPKGETDEFEPIEIPYEERATTTDGIECRDATIELLEDEISTLRAQLEKAREVKPLEWGGKQEAPRLTAPGYHISAKSELGVYRIDYFEAGHVKGGPFLVTTPDGRAIRNIERIDDAKDHAQADYQRRYNAMSQEGE